MLSAIVTGIHAQTLIQDFTPGSASSSSYIETDLNGEIFFSYPNATGGKDIYKYDGSSISLALPAHATTGETPSSLTTFNGKIYFTYFDNDLISGQTNGLYEWDGDASSEPVLITNFYSNGNDRVILRHSIVFNNKLYFSAQFNVNQTTLYVFDGVNAPEKVVDIYPNSGLVSLGRPANLTIFEDKLFFQASEGGDITFFSYDGISAPVAEFINFYNGQYESGGFPIHNNKMYGIGETTLSNAETRTIYEYDGVNAPVLVGNNLLAGHNHYASAINPKTIFDVLYFSVAPKAGSGGTFDRWEYDLANPAGVGSDTSVDKLSSNPIVSNGFAYLSGDGGSAGIELIKTDGVNRTVLTDINPNGDSFANYAIIYPLDDQFYFLADDGVTGFELYEYSLTVGLTKIENKAINIYPNPVQNELFIDLEETQITQMAIVDISGKIVQSVRNNSARSINVSNLNPGFYLLQIQTKNGTTTNRFIKK